MAVSARISGFLGDALPAELTSALARAEKHREDATAHDEVTAQPTVSTSPVADVLSPAHMYALFGSAATPGCVSRGWSDVVGVPCASGGDGRQLGVGFAVADGLLGAAAVAGCREEVQAMREAGMLSPAGMGKADSAWNEGDYRGDMTMWLSSLLPDDVAVSDASSAALASDEPRPPTPPRSRVPPSLQRMVQLLVRLQQQLRAQAPHLRLDGRMSLQLACYVSVAQPMPCCLWLPACAALPHAAWSCPCAQPGGGARYVRHLDAFKADGGGSTRRMTAIYYVNPAWREEDGGHLRLYLGRPDAASSSRCVDSSSSVAGDRYWDVAPLGDRLLVFHSEHVEHEVLPSFAHRYAITMWMYGAAQPTAAVGRAPRLRGFRVFVSVVSYRDSECQHTLRSLFDNAAEPDAIVVGLCLQVDREEDRACFQAPACRPRQVR
jgi:hypothetical protein